MGFLSLFSNFRLIAGVALIAAVVGAFGYLKVKLTVAEASAAQYQAESAQSKADAEQKAKESAELSAKIAEMNDRMKLVDELLAERERARVAAEKAAAIARKKYKDLLGELENADPNSCAMRDVDNGVIDWMLESTVPPVH